MKKVLLFASAVIAAAMAFSCNPEEPTVEASLVLKSQEAVEIPAEGASVEVSFVTNQDWTVKSDAAWATVDPAQGKAAEAAQTVKVEVAANDTEAERTATITVKASTIEKKVTVKQAAKAAEDPGENPGGDEPVETITSIATALATPGTYTIQGQVLATCTKGAVLADETAAIYVYKADAAAWEVGATYKVTGPTCVFNFGPELNGFESAEKVSDGTVPAAEPTVISVEAAEALIASIDGKDKSKDLVLSCQYVQIEGTLAISGTYYNVTIAGTDKAVASISYPAESLGLAAFDGKNIKVTGYLTSISGGKYLNIVTTAVEEGAAPAQPTGISSAADFVAFAAAVAAGDSTAFRNEAGEVEILADLDFAGVAEGSVNIQRFKGILNGNNHAIKNWSTSAALIDTLDATGVIKNLVIDASCNLTPAPTLAKKFNGFLANMNYGTAINVVNNANVSWKVESFSEGALGIMFGYSDDGSRLTDCVNNGSFTINGPGNTVGTIYLGTVSGRCNGKTTVMEGCCNNGNIEININDATTVKNFYIGGVTGSGTNGTTISKTINKGNVTITTKGQNAAVVLGGVVSYTSGKTSYCENHGNISYLSESAVKGSAVAGIAGYQDGGNGSVDYCVNRGVITLKGGYLAGRNSIGGYDGTKSYSTMHASVAGIVAYAYRCEFNNCDNYGNLFFTFDDLLNESSTFSGRAQMAGIVANSWGKVESCNNYGALNLVHHAKDRADLGKKNVMPIVGGIAGGDYAATKATQDETDIINCVNEGNISIDCDGYNSNCAYGGIVGWPHKESTEITHVTKGCTNRGNITVTGAGKSRTGGISGGTGPTEDCVNYGKITVSGQVAASAVGGVMGFLSQDHAVTGCSNYGDVTSTAVLTGGVGGIFGGRGNAEAQTGAGCKVNCSVTVPEGATEVGIVVGHWNGNTKAVTLGTNESPILVKGSIIKGTETTTLTAENFASFLWGTANYKSEVHSVIASYGE